MKTEIESVIYRLNKKLENFCNVQAIGMSSSHFPKNPSDGDLDIFIYCNSIPSPEKRKTIYDNFNTEIKELTVRTFVSDKWGDADVFVINGVEIWYMFFHCECEKENIDDILKGNQLKREGYYYPIGRCAMFSKMNILFDRYDYLKMLKKECSNYSEDFMKLEIQYHIECLDDSEGFDRAVMRKDILYYHIALDAGLDHLLRFLFALNKTFFPSRKRSFEYINQFKIKPKNTAERIRLIIRLGSEEKSLSESYSEFRLLKKDLLKLI